MISINTKPLISCKSNSRKDQNDYLPWSSQIYNSFIHINRHEDKHLIILSLDIEKAIDKIKIHFIIKILERLGIKETYLDIIKAIHKPTVNIMRNREKIYIKIRNLILSTAVKYSACVLTRVYGQESEIKETQTGKKEVKATFLEDVIIPYTKDHWRLHKKILTSEKHSPN